jgi:hypothetical protein
MNPLVSWTVSGVAVIMMTAILRPFRLLLHQVHLSPRTRRHLIILLPIPLLHPRLRPRPLLKPPKIMLPPQLLNQLLLHTLRRRRRRRPPLKPAAAMMVAKLTMEACTYC